MSKKFKVKNKNLKYNKNIEDLQFLPKFLHRKSILYTIVMFISLLKSGIWVFPSISASFIISQSLLVQPFSNEFDQYLMTYWFASFFANLIGIKTLAAFIIMHFVFGFAALIILYRFIRKNVRPDLQGKSLVLLAMLPTLSTIFYWTGMDTFIVFLMSCLAINYKKIFYLIIFGVIGGMHHFEIMLAGTATLLLYQLILAGTLDIKKIKVYLRNINVLSPLIMVFAVLIGKGILFLIFMVNEVQVGRDGISLGLYYFEKSAGLALTYLIPILWTMLGSIWLYFVLAISQRTRDSLALLISSLIPVALVFIVLDQTRILQLTGFLLMLFALIANNNFLIKLSDKRMKIVVILWLLMPWIWVWQKVFGSVTSYSFRYALSRIFNNDLAPWTGSITMWPFTF